MIKACGAIVFRREKGKVLFLVMKSKRWGHWDFPKGHADAGETEMQTAVRETEEETGLKGLKFVPGFREALQYHVDLTGDRTEAGMKESVYFLAESPSDKVILSHEHTDCKWLPFKQASSLIKFANTREMLKRANDFLSKL
jgi:8-oxo-dGTP pyrophosphatase MutT (NUDIX family)